jgi:hypothetical protein
MTGVRTPTAARISVLDSASIPIVWSTQPPIQWVPGFLSQTATRGRGVMLTTHPALVPRSRTSSSCIFTAPPEGLTTCTVDHCTFTFLFVAAAVFARRFTICDGHFFRSRCVTSKPVLPEVFFHAWPVLNERSKPVFIMYSF